ncbi:MAG: FAD-dependent oxidoreductase [Actinomycetia bacterium]|nr:FAD-dependent oxidoreductase [Actinomycetes bacterium]
MTVRTIDIAVIGGGPAGLTAGLYAARGGAETVIFERQACGGQIITTEQVENYPAFPEGVGGAELGELMTAQTLAQGAEIALFTEVTAIVPADGGFLLETNDAPMHARAVIVATGAVPSKLGIPGEAEFTGRGVSWCATCDGAFYRDKVVAVIGGGDAALEEAMFLTKFATKVYLVHRRHEFRAAQVIVDRLARHEKVEPVLGNVPVEILGDPETGKVCGLVLRDVADGSERTLVLDGVFEFVGTTPISELLSDGLVSTDERGYIRTDARGATGVPGLFAAGDVTESTLKQVVTAAGAGATAGFSALNYLETL